MPEDPDLLGMLAEEADRRCESIIGGAEEMAKSGDANPQRIEALGAEAHGLTGAASVVGQERLAELAKQLELALIERAERGTIDVEFAATVITAASALREGAQAAAEGVGEPGSVADSLAKLTL